MTSGASGHRRGTTRRRPTRRCSNRSFGRGLDFGATCRCVLRRRPPRPACMADFYAETLLRLGPPDIVDAIRVETARGVARGPYGRYPHGPLSGEDEEGPDYRVSAGTATAFGRGLAAALEHAHLLVFHPATQARRRCISFSMRDGRRRTSLPCRSLYRSWLSRFASWWACAHCGRRSDGAIDSPDTPVFVGILASGHL